MKPHPRIRKTIKWGGAALTLLLVAAWIGSVWWGAGWESGSGEGVLCVYGGVKISLAGFPDPYGAVATIGGTRGWLVFSHAPAMLFRPFLHNLNGGFSRSFIPLWIPILVVLAITSLAWRLDTLARRSSRAGLCPKCRYDRAGLATGAVCPECGVAAGEAGAS